MTIKKIITCGCSFSDPGYAVWAKQIEYHILSINDEINFEHLGMGSQGNELIQKKTSLAILESLEKYNPDEIAVFVMWSGTERKAFYINNPDTINEAVKTGFSIWGTQFTDLKNNIKNKEILTDERGQTLYDKLGGWYNCNFLYDVGINLEKEYFKSTIDNTHATHVSIENIIMLQNLCKLQKIILYQQFYRSYVYEDFLKHQETQMVKYLYKQLDHSTIILEKGIFEYLRNNNIIKKTESPRRWSYITDFIFPDNKVSETDKYFFSRSDDHPNELGHEKWFNDIILPRLLADNFLNQCIK